MTSDDCQTDDDLEGPEEERVEEYAVTFDLPGELTVNSIFSRFLCSSCFYRLKGHSQLWDRADLDTSFLTSQKNVHPNMESKFI